MCGKTLSDREELDAYSGGRSRFASGNRQRRLVRFGVNVVGLVSENGARTTAQTPAAPARLEAAVRDKRVVRVVLPRRKRGRSRRGAGEAEARGGRSGARSHCDRTADESE